MTKDPQLNALSPAKQALYEIRRLRGRIEELERSQNEPIAVIGMGMRFPGGASDEASFWEILASGADAVTEIPASRWPVDLYYDPNPDAPGRMYTRHGAFLSDPALFDADFFGIARREAETLDPQHRLLLETAWEALEHAGQSPSKLAGSATGVFVALSNGDYGRMVFAEPGEIDAWASTGNIFSVAAGRISYALGLEGPSMAVDTACSGSLVSVHLACQSLRTRECRTALAGGVNLILSPEIHINFCRSRMLAPDGRCKTFDAAANGYVRGEGCGVVVLKRLSDAVADGDRVLALLRGSAVNQDGRSGGLTVPSGPAQQTVIRQALANAGIQPADISYIEAHGTGTSLGDPIEAHALASVFAQGRTPNQPLVIGSVKTNIGHLEAAAGIAGLIKVILSLQHQQIPPHLHFRSTNPHIDWNGLPVQIPVAGQDWPSGTRRRLAGISSFGFSGTNAHVIVEEAPAVEPAVRQYDRPLHLLTLSARSETALSALVSRYRDHLQTSHDNIADICFTANAGRAHFSHRSVFIAGSSQELRDRLLAPPLLHGVAESVPEVAFLFTGQGDVSDFSGELFDACPAFRSAVEECGADRHASLFAIQYALAELWRSWGINPSAVAGQGAGVFAAACVAGMFRPADGVRIASAGNPAASAALAAELAGEPRITMVSNATCNPLTEAEWRDPQYWLKAQNAVGVNPAGAWPVRVEIHPNQTAWPRLLENLARLYVSGVEVDWDGVDAPFHRRRIALPTYPFERQRYWIAQVRDDKPVSTAVVVPVAPRDRSRVEQIASAPGALRRDMLIDVVREQIGPILRIHPNQIDRRRRLTDLGLDSLMAVELRNRIAAALDITEPLRATLVFDYPTVEDIAGHLEQDVLRLPDEHSLNDVFTEPVDPAAAMAAQLEELSEEEAEELLLRKLETL